MSTQRGNVKKSRPPKYQNKAAFKNVYHDTSKRTQQIVTTDVSGVCARCKDCIDWKIKYKKYKPLSQAKTCADCKQKTVKQAYHVFCIPCSQSAGKCAKCGEKKEIVLQPKPSIAEQASDDRVLQFELEQMSERKRRTFLRLQQKGLLTGNDAAEQGNHGDGSDLDSESCNSDDENDLNNDVMNDSSQNDDLECMNKISDSVNNLQVDSVS